MASNVSKIPFLRIVAKRGYAAAACPRPTGQVATVESKVLNNKVVVASAESQMPVSRVAIVFRAGSRFESYDMQGASHMLRIAAGLSTKNSTGFAITRNLQQIGAGLTVSSDREIVAYTLEATADQLDIGLRFLRDSIAPLFKPWEIADSVLRVKTQVANVPPQVQAIELLHKAAFRTGLGNSVYIPEFKIGKLSCEDLQHYHANHFTTSRCAVVGVGVDLSSVAGFAQTLELPGDGSKTDSARYFGGDGRKDTAGNMSHVAVAGQGGALNNQKEALAFAILQQAAGTGAVAKYGRVNGTFGKALTSAIGDASVSFSALNANYSDAGLFGFVVSTDAQNIGKAVEAVTHVLKSGSVSAEDVNRGKTLLKAAVLEAYGTDKALISEMSTQAAILKNVVSADTLIAAIDAISHKDVQEAAKKAGSSKLSVGAVGNLANVPYASDLA